MNGSDQRVIEVNQADFQAEVIERSYSVPVVVDFWAPWCGPCRMLSPVLERLARDPNNGFILAKVNADNNPGLSGQYGVRGIPAVKAFSGGRVVDEFVGAQPEPRVREFIQRLMAGAGQTRTAPPGQESADPAIRLQQARQLLEQGKGCEARAKLESFPAGPRADEAKRLLAVAQFVCDMGRRQGGDQAELDNLYQQAADAVRRREYSTALYNLMTIVRQDKNYRQGQARQVVNGLFVLLGEQHQLTQTYRQQMASLA